MHIAVQEHMLRIWENFMCPLVATPSEAPFFMEIFSGFFLLYFFFFSPSYSTPWHLTQLSVLFLAAPDYMDWGGHSG